MQHIIDLPFWQLRPLPSQVYPEREQIPGRLIDSPLCMEWDLFHHLQRSHFVHRLSPEQSRPDIGAPG